MSVTASRTGSYEERECCACIRGFIYDGQAGAWVERGTCSGTGRDVVFVYAKPKSRRLGGCAGCGGRFRGRDLFEVGDDNLTFFEGDRLCGPCARDHGVL